MVRLVSASKNENNGYHGGKPEGSSGKEIKLQNYYNFPWDCVLRYTLEDSSLPLILSHSQLLEMQKSARSEL